MVVSIGVVDTGIDARHAWLQRCRVDDGGSVDAEGNVCESGGDEDVWGHGTGVVALIHAFCPDASLLSVRITQSAIRSPWNYVTSKAMAAGVERCIDRRVDVINIGYSIGPGSDTKPLASACQRAYDEGIVLVASHSNSVGESNVPASLQTVIGVRRSDEPSRGTVSVLSLEDRDVAAWGGPMHVAWRERGVAYLGGTSFSGAHVSAIVGRIKSAHRGLDCSQAFHLLCQTCTCGTVSS